MWRVGGGGGGAGYRRSRRITICLVKGVHEYKGWFVLIEEPRIRREEGGTHIE